MEKVSCIYVARMYRAELLGFLMQHKLLLQSEYYSAYDNNLTICTCADTVSLIRMGTKKQSGFKPRTTQWQK